MTPHAQEPHPAGELLSAWRIQARIVAFVAHYNHLGYHESIVNLTPATSGVVKLSSSDTGYAA